VTAQCRCRSWASAFLLAALASSVAGAAPTTLVDLLRSLSAKGLDILYSSDLVTPDLTVPPALHETDLLRQAREALAAHHLELRSDGQKRYIVARSAMIEAPGPADSRSERSVDEVTVFASRYVLEDDAASQSVSLGHHDLEEVPGAHDDVMRAIRTVPGLADNLSSRPYVRGAFLEDVLVRFDGIPMVDPFHFKNFQNLISAFDPATVDRIDVYTGGFPVKYGTRSAGVIDVTPRAVDTGYEHRIGANLLSYDLSTVGRADSLPIDWLATVRHSGQNVVLQPGGGDVGEPSYADALGRVRWQVNSATALTAGWLLLDDRVKSSLDPSTEQAVAHDRDFYYWLTAEWAASGAVHSRTSVAVTDSQRTVLGNLTLPGAATGQLDERRDISTVDLRTDWTYLQTDSLLWNLGAETTFERADLNFSRQEDLDAALAASLNRMADVSLEDAQSPRSTTFGLYASVRQRWRRFEAEWGVRLDHQDYRGFGSHSQLSPRINLRFDPTPVWHFYGSWGHFWQAQRAGEWRAEQPQSYPDPATHVVGVIAGVAHDSSAATHWRLELYENHWLTVHPYFDNALNRLSLLPELGLDRVLIKARGGDSMGIETSVRHDFAEHWVVSGSYTLSRATDDLAVEDVLRSWDQTHAFNSDLTWQRAMTSASLVIGWHSGWPKTPVSYLAADATAPANFRIGPRNSSRWGSYFSTDVRVARTVPLRRADVLLWVDATNVTNRANECCIAYGKIDSAGNLLMPVTNSWFPRTVNVGFDWRIRPGR
jgi:TonB dependent receptor/TonB-dependent Receptor Plug Domain